MKKSKVSLPMIVAVVAVIGVVFLVLLSNGLHKDEQVKLPLLVEEFGDYECPACGVYYPIVKQIKQDYKDKQVTYVFKNFPLTSLHPYAYNSSLAAEAARLQGKFDEYHDKLYENQNNLTDADLVKYATDLGLDVTKFKTDMASQTVKDTVDADIADGNARGVNATPTFFVNGQQVVFLTNDTVTPDQKLRQIIDDKLALGIKQAGQATSTVSVTPTPTISPTTTP